MCLFVADDARHPLFRLPDDGFSEEVLRGFAAAGLAFVIPDTGSGAELDRLYPGYDSHPRPYYDLRRNRADRERSVAGRVRRLLRRS